MATVTAISIDDVPKISHREAIALARTQNDAFLRELRALDPSDWDTVTDCDPWTVHDIAAHLSAWAEAILSPAEFLRQRRGAIKVRKEWDNVVDAQNAVQVEERKSVPPDELIARLDHLFPRFLKMRDRLGLALKPVPAWNGLLGFYSLGYLCDAIFTRDVFMHRADVSRATGKEMPVGADERRIVMDCLKEWREGSKVDATLHLGGADGGEFVLGEGTKATITCDAVDLMRVLSGRPRGGSFVIEGDTASAEAWLSKGVRF